MIDESDPCFFAFGEFSLSEEWFLSGSWRVKICQKKRLWGIRGMNEQYLLSFETIMTSEYSSASSSSISTWHFNYFYKELNKYLCNSRWLWTLSVHCPSTAITINGLKCPTWTTVSNATFDIMTEIKSSLPFSCPGVWNFNSRIQTARRHYFLIRPELGADPWLLIGQLTQSCPLIGWALHTSGLSRPSPWSSCGRSHNICKPMTHHRGKRRKCILNRWWRAPGLRIVNLKVNGKSR